ncbi:hypothetical protein BY996DRAFT_6439498 [Phakopsora pachyrhizi]|nr:hypothetical protein BY996DRAFT_6439498 [Phakopsora pachyrhizi]
MSIGSSSDKGNDLKNFPTSSSYPLLTQSSSSDRGSILDFKVSLYASDVLIYADFIRAGASIQSLVVEERHVETSRNQSNGFTPRFESMQVRKDMKVILFDRSRESQRIDLKKQIELGLLGSSKGRIQLAVLMNLHLKFRNKERTKEIQDLSQSLDMTNDDSRENRREPTRQ